MKRTGSRIGIIGRIKILRHHCPKCAGRLERVIAPEECFTANIPVRSARATSAQIPIPSGFTKQVTLTPVYLVCKNCGFRIRRKNIKN